MRQHCPICPCGICAFSEFNINWFPSGYRLTCIFYRYCRLRSSKVFQDPRLFLKNFKHFWLNAKHIVNLNACSRQRTNTHIERYINHKRTSEWPPWQHLRTQWPPRDLQGTPTAQCAAACQGPLSGSAGSPPRWWRSSSPPSNATASQVGRRVGVLTVGVAAVINDRNGSNCCTVYLRFSPTPRLRRWIGAA